MQSNDGEIHSIDSIDYTLIIMSSWKDPFGSKYPRDKEDAKRDFEQRKGETLEIVCCFFSS